MPPPIARGRVSHTLGEDLRWLLDACFGRIKDEDIVHRAERAFAAHVGRKDCIVFPFARTAIHAVLQGLELEPGDRVLLPPVTIKPILDVVLDLGLEPVFVDIDPSTACFDSEVLRRAIEQEPKVAILTYLFGLVPDLDDLMGQLRDAGVFVIEDFSQCLNGRWQGRSIGTFGDVSIYSASSIKTFDTYGGGFLVLDDQERTAALREVQRGLEASRRMDVIRKVLTSLVRNLATQRSVFALVTWPALRLVRRAGRGDLARFTGSRDEQPRDTLPAEWFRAYSAVQARVALEQLPKTHPKDAVRIARIERVDAGHSLVDRPTGHPAGEHVHWQHIVYSDDVAATVDALPRHGVDSATTSLVLISALPAYPFQGSTPNGTRLYRSGLYLPCYHQLRESEADRIAAALESLAT
jgi:perosamine synthetase